MAKETDSMYKDESTPKWLKTIQLNSWEAELLISALVLYTLFQVPDFLDKFSLQNFGRGSLMHRLLEWIVTAIRILSFGYILHIIVRGIWVASVGLSYVFPKGVDTSELKFKGKFRKELESNGSLVKMVLRLEELSSIIYGISFVFFGVVLGFTAFLFSFIFFIEWINPIMNEYMNVAAIAGIFMLFYAFLTLLVFIDFLTNGLFRRKNWSADWFYYVAWIFRIVTLSFLYRRSLLVLISNVKGWKKYLIPFIILGFVVGFIRIKDTRELNKIVTYYKTSAAGDYNSANYENIRGKDSHLAATIQSDIVTDNILKVFLKDIGGLGGVFLFEDKDFDKDKWDTLPSDSISQYLNKRLSVKIDDQKVRELDWYTTQHPSTYDYGFTAFIDLDTINRGTHFFKIGIDTTGLKPRAKEIVQRDKYSLQTIGNIYFFYDKQ